LKFLQTPGHTFESISILVTDLDQGPGPYAVLTGDTLFIGDVGRPDLSDTYTPAELAGFLYNSLNQKLLTLPDDVLVYPAHGAGSMCGRNISTDRTSTIGRERKSNYALQPMSRTQFVALMTEDLPPRPEYFERDVQINRRGAPSLTEVPPLPALAPDEALLLQQERGAKFLDLRSGAAFCGGHVPGSINIGLSGQFAAWAGSVVGLDCDLILVAEDLKSAEEARQRLARVGIERVIGFLDQGISGWVRAGLLLQQIEEILPQDMDEQLSTGNMYVLDVRRKAEWVGGHISGAVLIPLDDLRKMFGTLDQDRPVVVHCKGGYRSTIACSLLQANGFKRVINLRGGIDAWTGAGLATTA
jgi:rhodanese-related sulfurtransferase